MNMHALDDIALAAAIAAHLQADSRVPADIIVAVSEGVVTLEGCARSRHQRDAAEAVARAFNHAVRRVVNEIMVAKAG